MLLDSLIRSFISGTIRFVPYGTIHILSAEKTEVDTDDETVLHQPTKGHDIDVLFYEMEIFI